MSAFTDRMYILEYKEQLRQAEKRRKERNMEEIKKEIEKTEKKKQQKEELKEYQKSILLALKQDLQNRFEKDFSLQGVKAKYRFYNIKTRTNIIKSLAKNSQEIDFLEENYNKILNNTIKKYELHEKYLENEIQEEIESNKEINEKKVKNSKILDIICRIVLFPVKHILLTILFVFFCFFTYMWLDAFGFGLIKSMIYSIITIVLIIGIFTGFIK